MQPKEFEYSQEQTKITSLEETKSAIYIQNIPKQNNVIKDYTETNTNAAVDHSEIDIGIIDKGTPGRIIVEQSVDCNHFNIKVPTHLLFDQEIGQELVIYIYII